MNGKDDDRNGFVDDVNGIAWSWTGERVAGVLLPVEIPPEQLAAAKLFARWPKLTAVQARKLIVDGADERVVTGRTLRLLNPRRSFELAEALAAGKSRAKAVAAPGKPAGGAAKPPPAPAR